MSRFKVDASLKRDKEFEEEMEALQREMARRDKLLAAANQITSAPSYPKRGFVTSRGDAPKIPPTGSFFGQQSQQPNLMDEHEPEPDFFTQAGSSQQSQQWPADSAPLPAELAGLKVPLGTGPTQLPKSMRPTAEAFAAKAKAGLLNDMNKGGKSHRRRALKAKRSRKARRASRRSRRAMMARR